MCLSAHKASDAAWEAAVDLPPLQTMTSSGGGFYKIPNIKGEVEGTIAEDEPVILVARTCSNASGARRATLWAMDLGVSPAIVTARRENDLITNMPLGVTVEEVFVFYDWLATACPIGISSRHSRQR